MADKTTVHNPPAGGDQTQASTNDDNINEVLHDKPYVVAISDGEREGVVARFSDQADADASAKAFKAKRPQKRIELKAIKENDPENGLPSFVAEHEAERVGVEETEEAAPAEAAAEGGEEEAEGGDYAAMSKADLQAEADARGVEYAAAATKADIVAALEAEDAAG